MDILYCFTCLFFRLYFKLFFRLKVEGAEHTASEEGALIAATHASYLDPPLVGCTTEAPCHFLARESLFRAPLLRHLIRHLNTHPVHGSSSLQSIRTVVGLLKEGTNVVIFPEGHRSPDGSLQPIQPGISLIVSRAECPIIPCKIEGAYQAWGRHRKFPKPWGRIRVAYGKPIPWEQFAHLDKKARQAAICEATEQALRSL